MVQTPVKQPENQANKASAAKSNFFGGGSGASFFQAKLTVNQPGDKYEQEADAVADKVVNRTQGQQAGASVQAAPMNISSIQREAASADKDEEPVQRKEQEEQEKEPMVQRMEDSKEEEVQRMTDESPAPTSPTQEKEEEVQRKEEEEEEKVQRVEQEEESPIQRSENAADSAAQIDGEKDEEKVQAKEVSANRNKYQQSKQNGENSKADTNDSGDVAKPAPAAGTRSLMDNAAEETNTEKPLPPKTNAEQPKTKPINTEEEPVQAKTSQTNGLTPSTTFASQLHSSKGSGSPLSSPVRDVMENNIGADFSQVRIHTDHQAAELNREINAKAFTHGHDIYFNDTQYNPATNEGKHLLAHELTHTIQQGAAEKITPKREEETENTPDNQQISNNPEPAVHADASDDSSGVISESIPADLQIEGDIPEIAPDPVESTVDPIEPEVSAAELSIDDANLEEPAEVEQVEEIKTVEHSGNSEEMAKMVATSSASQMAASYGGLGTAISTRLQEETQETAAETPQLHAKNTGAKEQLLGSTISVSATPDAKIGEGTTSANPEALKLPEHQNRGEAPNNERDKERQVDSKGEEAYFEWVKNRPANLFGGIQTQDQNLNTSAGERPKFDRQGDADPERNKNSRKDGDAQSADAQKGAATEFANNNGQQRIVPVMVDEKKTVTLANQPEALKTEDAQAALDYVDAPLPANIRAAADAKLAAQLQPKLGKATKDIDAAAANRDTEKKTAVDDHQKQADTLNEQATKEQVDAVKANRKTVADKQREGIEESGQMLRDYHKEADKEQTSADKEVHDRIKVDEEKADTELKTAETKAEEERKRGEAEAAEVKRKKEEEAKDDSWWGSFKRAVKSVVKAISSAIDKVFNAVRKVVKGLIDAAKKAALAVIEAGRKWIVDKLNKFRDALKGMVNKLLANFPALRDKVNAFIDKTVDAAIDTVNKAADLLKKGVEALANALGKVLDKILSVFQTALKAAVAIVGAVITGDFAEALRIAIQAACEIAGIDPKPVFDFFDRAGKAIMKILKAPLTFIKNVGKGIGGGFKLFWKNITENLKAGVIAWLTGSMKETPLKLPETWDIKGIFSIVAQLVGLTLENIKAKFIKAMGPKGAMIWAKVEKTAEFAQKIGKLVTQGPAAIWEFAKDAVGNIKEVVLTAIRNWLSLEVIKQGIIWLLSLTNPASALAKAVKMLFDVAMFLVNRFNQIKDFVLAVYEMISDMVAGNVAKIVTAVENVLKRLIPLVIGLIAAVLSLGSLADKVTGIIKKFTMPIERVIMKIVRWLVKKAKTMVKKAGGFVKEKAGKLMEWWKVKKEFKYKDGTNHKMYFNSNLELIVESKPTALDKLISHEKKVTNKSDKDKVSKLSVLETKSVDLKKLRSEIKSKSVKNDKDKSAKKASEIEGVLNEIKKILIELEIGKEDKDLPKTHVEFEYSNQRPERVIAEPLTKIPGNTVGSHSQNQIDIPGFKEIPDEIRKNFWVKAHLLNGDLHGPANPKNLVPATKEVNNNQKNYIENPAKELVSLGNTLRFIVTVDYYSFDNEIPYKHYFPKIITMYYAPIEGKEGNYTEKYKRKRNFELPEPNFEKNPDQVRAQVPSINQSSATPLYEASKKVPDLEIPLSLWKKIVTGRETAFEHNHLGQEFDAVMMKIELILEGRNVKYKKYKFAELYESKMKRLIQKGIIKL